MRVIAGAAKGTKLAPVPDGTRPMLDRAREGLFSSLGSALLAGARVLDLYSGTGSITLEALSRGAERAVLVDSSPAAARAMRTNLDRARLRDRATVLRRDVSRLLPAGPRGDGFDLVFLDPPYAIPVDELAEALDLLGARGWLRPGGIAVLTRSKNTDMPVIPLDWLLDRRLTFGDAVVFVFKT